MTEPRTFDELGLPAPLQQAIEARGLTAPTQVQVLISDPLHAGKDLLVSSQTGSGKTLAFGFLVAREIADDAGRVKHGTTPSALVVAPTRELAVQVQRELEWLFEKTGARVVSVTGGTDAREEMRKLRRGVEILVATPGRLIDHLDRKNVDLKGLKVAVLDEADEMLDLGFRDALERILQSAAPDRRTHLFSATLPPQILKLARTYQKDAQRIAAGAGGGKTQHQDIEFIAHLFAPGQREAAVVNVLRRHDAPAAIVFTKTRVGSSELGAALARRGFASTVISGDLTQSERTRALSALREGRARVLVATDVAARGLDLPDVGLVIHADPPMEHSGLTHRSGRTGRAGKKGVSVLLTSRGERAKSERLMRDAGIVAKWTPLPTADEIANADRERMVETLKADAGEPAGSEAAMVDRLLEEVPVRELVTVLVRRMRSSLPEPVVILNVAPDARRESSGRDFGRESSGRGAARPSGRFDRHDRGQRPLAGGSRFERPERVIKSGYVAFRVNVGQDRNAEPRWLLPLICRRGGVTGADVGSIDIRPRSSTFEIRKEKAEQFEAAALKRDPSDPAVRFARELSRDELAKFEATAPRREPRAGAPPARAPDGEGAPARAPREEGSPPPRAPRSEGAPARSARSPWEAGPRRDARPASGHAPAKPASAHAPARPAHAPASSSERPTRPSAARPERRATPRPAKPVRAEKPPRPGRANARPPEGYDEG